MIEMLLSQELKVRLKGFTKEIEKARWWLDIGIYEYARDNRYIITREEHDEAYLDLQNAEADLLEYLKEETVLLPMY
jgi:hypothetical protein